MYLKINKPLIGLIDSDTSDSSSDEEELFRICKSQRPKSKHVIVKLSKDIGETKRLKPNDKRKCLSALILKPCQYTIIGRTAQKFGFEEVTEDENWDLHWSEMFFSVHQCKELKRFQKLNHLPGMLELCRKDLMARNLNRMLRLFPNDYNFFPKTWCIPAELNAAIQYSKSYKNTTFILKPDIGRQGNGIMITKSLSESLAFKERGVCQLYIEKPFLIDGYKFDMRLYALISSCEPLRIYRHKEGLVRFASCQYNIPQEDNLSNVFMHLTNYAVNKQNGAYRDDSGQCIKRKLSWLIKHMKSLKYDVEDIFYKIDDMVVKMILSVYPVIRHIYLSRFSNHNVMPACIELLGLDVLIDENMKPLLLEVNYSPSYDTDTVVDLEVKEALFNDLFAMINLNINDKMKIIHEDSNIVKKRLLNKKNNFGSARDPRCFAEYFRREFENRGGFRLLYPGHLDFDYAKYIKQS